MRASAFRLAPSEPIRRAVASLSRWRIGLQIFTLIEGDYSKGAAALVNSIARCGGAYEVHVGCIGETGLAIRPGAPVTMHALPAGETWAGNRKFELISRVARGKFLFIDADCILMSPEILRIAAEALETAPLFCVEGILPNTDIRRARWERICENVLGLKGGARQHLYFNSGFFGGDIVRDGKIFETWQRLIKGALGDSGLFSVKQFPMADQDCLNAVLQCLQTEIVTLGPPDIVYAASPINPFVHLEIEGCPLLCHQTGENKPWKITHVPPRQPSAAEREWYALVTQATPWCTIATDLPSSVRAWLEQSVWGRMLGYGARVKFRLSGRNG